MAKTYAVLKNNCSVILNLDNYFSNYFKTEPVINFIRKLFLVVHVNGCSNYIFFQSISLIW